MHLARFLLGTMIGVPIRVSQSHELYKNRQVLLPLLRADRIQQGMATPFWVDRIRQTYAARSTSRPRYTCRDVDVDTASYPTTYIAHTVRLSAPFASSRNADSLSSEPHINIHEYSGQGRKNKYLTTFIES